MSTVKPVKSGEHRAAPVDQGEESVIASYLDAHPDFFERHGTLLAKLKLPHSTGGPAVSLIERQVSVLRQRNETLDNRLRDLVEVARGNDELADKIHALAVQLMGARDRREVVESVEKQLRVDFKADRSVLVLLDEPADGLRETGRFLRVAAREEEALGPFRAFLDGDSVRCGPVRDAQRDYLFGSDDCEIGSVALIPLGKKSERGFLVIGSRSADHFNPGVSIDFLSRLGELVAAALAR